MNQDILSNQTLVLILNYFKRNKIESIEQGMEKGVIKSFTEMAGYIITIPVEDGLPKSFLKDKEELEGYNETLVELSDGTHIKSYLITGAHTTLSSEFFFASHETQLKLILEMSKGISN
jgi:hypothetical protein